jgi:hypothetical protein
MTRMIAFYFSQRIIALVYRFNFATEVPAPYHSIILPRDKWGAPFLQRQQTPTWVHQKSLTLLLEL